MNNIPQDSYVYLKEVDRSLLKQGLSIPISIQVVLNSLIKNSLQYGESKKIKLILDNQEFDAKLINQKFDKTRYPAHKDILQIRYNDSNPIVNRLRDIFSHSYRYILAQQMFLVNKKATIRLPKDSREYLALFTTTL